MAYFRDKLGIGTYWTYLGHILVVVKIVVNIVVMTSHSTSIVLIFGIFFIKKKHI